ncbi:MAG: zinc-ribbon domain-containing protein [Deltaproteobacteria bacterium]|nr:zinc-ribbon domain-containing protein [Deltaproteobacteria bacterium]
MIVICEECGKKYRVDASKIKGETAKVKCRSCNHLITVSKPAAAETDKLPPIPPKPADSIRTAIRPSLPKIQLKNLGIREKMFIVFFLFPIILMAVTGWFSVNQLNEITSYVIASSYQMAVTEAEKSFNEKAIQIAKQVELYLLSHPELDRKDFNKDLDFKMIVFQRGLAASSPGFVDILKEFKIEEYFYATTSLYIRASGGKPAKFIMHPEKKKEGKALNAERVAGKLNGFKYDKSGKIVLGGEKSKFRETSNYYLIKDKKKKLREKFMAIAPIAGTPYGISVEAYSDDILSQVSTIRERANKLKSNAVKLNVIFLVLVLFIVGAIVSLYGHRISKRLKDLTEVADRISVGELEAEIDTTVGDEIGELSEAISRMQDSIRLSIQRLRRRR